MALSFASGKALRVAAPFLIVLGLLGSVILAAGSAGFATLAAMQIAGLLGAAVGALMGNAAPRAFAVARYAVAGHIASATGVAQAEELIGAMNLTLSADQLTLLTKASTRAG